MIKGKHNRVARLLLLAAGSLMLFSSSLSIFTPLIANASLTSKNEQNSRTVLYALAKCLPGHLKEDRTSPSITDELRQSSTNLDVIWTANGSGETVAVGYEVDPRDGNAECNNISLSHLSVIGKTPAWLFEQLYPSKDPEKVGTYLMASSFEDRVKSLAEQIKNEARATGGISQDERERRLAVAFLQCNEVAPDSANADAVVSYGGTKYTRKEDGPNKISVGYDMQSDDGKYECNTLLKWDDKEEMTRALQKYGQEAASLSSDTSGGAGEGEISCQGGVLGWILCPFVTVMADVIRETAGVIDDLMQFRLLATASTDANTDGTQAGVQSNVSPSTILRAAWQNFLNIANILLVVAFLAIIFSQATSAGISNYGIKKMLPRLVLGAILMNLSFYICAFAVDITNILGSSILGLFQGMSNISGDPSIQGAMDQLSGPSGLRQGIAATVLAVAAAVAVVLFFLVPVLLAVLLVLIILAGRQVILTVLILVSPLAFVAWLLPNTEQYFKKWWSLFTQMLFAYPIVMAVFGASLFVASLIQAVNRVEGENIGGALGVVLPLVVLSIPLFLLPKIIMSTNSMLGKIGGVVKQGYNATGLTALGGKQRKAAWGITGQPVANRAGYEVKRSRPGRFFRNQAARGKNTNKRRQEEFAREEAEAVATHEINHADESTPAGQRRIATAQATLDGLKEDAIKQQVAMLSSQAASSGRGRTDFLKDQLIAAGASGDKDRAAAAVRALGASGSGGIDSATAAIKDLEDNGHLDTSTTSGVELKSALSSEILSNGSMTDANPELGGFAGNNQTLAAARADSGTWSKISADDIAKLTKTSISEGGDHLGAEAIKTALHPDNIGKLKGDKLVELRAIANRRGIPY